MEKLILALVTTAKRLQPYFQAHTIEIVIEHPMKQILHKLETFGRLVKWVIEMSEFNTRNKISVITDISVLGFYGNIGNIEKYRKISVDILTKISVM